LSKFINLEKLYSYNTKFTGSLEPLAGMTKLKSLNINNTDLDSGLEYLPESVEIFDCSADERKDAKVKAIYNLVGNSTQKLHDYKR
jgi:hypothetical protein